MKQASSLLRELSTRDVLLNVFGSVILSFGLYQIHSFSGVTEGGVLGLTLLLQNWWSLSPALTGAVLNAACYLFGWQQLGRRFLLASAVAAGSFSLSYWLFEQFPPLWPELYRFPFAAAILGAVFVGVGVGLCVRAGGAPSGDDALAMALSHKTGLKLQWIYLFSDLTVLGLSLSYIPPQRLIWSLVTVVLSGQIIGRIHKLS